MPNPTVILFHKPFGVLSQFTSKEGKTTLASFGPFPGGVYPVGRLDMDSEGLLLLTDDTHLNHRLTDPKFGHERSYWVQVERIPDDAVLRTLGGGVVIAGASTRPARVRRLTEPPNIPDRDPPIRHRKHVPTAWIELTLTEGRNRQVRRMTAATGYPTLRLIRWRIAGLTIDGLDVGASRIVRGAELRALYRDIDRAGS